MPKLKGDIVKGKASKILDALIICLEPPKPVSKLWTKYVRGGRPSGRQVDDVRVLRFSDESEKEITRRVVQKINQSFHGKEVAQVSEDGKKILAGKMLGDKFNDDAIVIFFPHTLDNNLYFIVKYRLESQNSHKVFEHLGLKDAGEKDPIFSNDVAAGEYNWAYPPENEYTRKKYWVSVNAESFFKSLGMDENKIAVSSHKEQMQRAENFGVDYIKYLEARGEGRDGRLFK